MASKKMTDDEIMDFTYNKMFGDLDNIRSGMMFSDDGKATQGAASNAGTPGNSGIEISIKPLMAGAQEGARPSDTDEKEEDEEII